MAVIELVKNAYDADARFALVRFTGEPERGRGGIDVEDDGHGMTLHTVESAWMEPATAVKKKGTRSAYLGRRVLGEKGVGRFAAARLASELELITRAQEAKKEVYVLFDWSQFDRDELYLDQVLILAEERAPQDLLPGREVPIKARRTRTDLPRDGSHGTILRMSRLKRAWGSKELDDLTRGLSRLVSPFDNSQGFQIFVQRPGQTQKEAQEVEPPTIIKYPHYTIEGEVSADGRYQIDYNIHASGTSSRRKGFYRVHEESLDDPTPSLQDVVDAKIGNAPECGPIAFKILVWDRDQLENIDQKLGTGIRSIRKDLDSVAGISIYRDGFRVLPYGEPENDWLRLDIRRVQNPTLRLSNNQITGYVRIGADSNPDLRDQSNREGLDSNHAYANLQELLLLVLSHLESLRFQEKKKKPTSETKATGGLLEIPDLSVLRSRLSASGSDPATLKLFEETSKAWEGQIVRVRDVLSRYHSLATLGQLVDKVVHDSRQPLATIQGQSALAEEFLDERLGASGLAGECIEALSNVRNRLSKIRSAASLIDLVIHRIEPLGGRKKGRPTKLYLEEIIRNAFSHFEQDLANEGIKVSIPTDQNLVSVDASELQEVLINLISNSLHWLTHVPKTRRMISVDVTRKQPGEIELLFSDSGPGVLPEHRQSIFEPYFTTKPDGIGLGLVIAGEIVREYYSGTLELLESGPLPGAVFRIVLRRRVS